MTRNATHRPEPRSVSVILAVRNGGPLLDLQLTALAGQRCSVPLEVVVADNGSSDDSAERVTRHASTWAGLRAVSAAHVHGQRAAQRVGVGSSSGELLLFVDADDVVPPGWVQAMVVTAVECDVVAGAVEVDSLNDEMTIRSRPYVRETGTRGPAESLGAGPYAIGAAMGLWRDVWDKVDNPAQDLPASCRGGGEDRHLSWAARRAGHVIGFCPHPAVAYRLRPAGRHARQQLRSYGIADAALAARYPDLGASGDGLSAGLRKWVFLVPRAARAWLRGDEAHWARSELAVAVGRAEGSLRFRVTCL